MESLKIFSFEAAILQKLRTMLKIELPIIVILSMGIATALNAQNTL